MTKTIQDLAQAVLDYEVKKIDREQLLEVYTHVSKQPNTLRLLVGGLLREIKCYKDYRNDDDYTEGDLKLLNNTVKEARIILKSEPLIAPSIAAPTMPLTELTKSTGGNIDKSFMVLAEQVQPWPNLTESDYMRINSMLTSLADCESTISELNVLHGLIRDFIDSGIYNNLECGHAMVKQANLCVQPTESAQLSGGVNDYYTVTLASGTVVECKDVIRALGLNFDQGNIMKSLWREGKKPDNPAIRDKEKIVYSACEELFAAAGVNGVSARRALLVKLLGW